MERDRKRLESIKARIAERQAEREDSNRFRAKGGAYVPLQETQLDRDCADLAKIAERWMDAVEEHFEPVEVKG